MANARKARVFEGHKCTTGIHNALLDVVMPELSANAWKLLCVLIRQTTGWDREEQGASYSTLMSGTGIKSKATIAACLKELEEYRYQLISVKQGRQHDESRYTVNRDVEIDWIPQNFANFRGSKIEPLRQSSGSKNEPLYGSKIEPLKQSSGSKNELSYRKESNNLKQREREELLSLAEPDGEEEGLPKAIKDVTGFVPADLRDEQKLWALAEKLRGQNITAEMVRLYAATRKSQRPKMNFLYEDILQWDGVRESAVSANHLRLVDQMPDGLDEFGKVRWLKEQLAKGAAA